MKLANNVYIRSCPNTTIQKLFMGKENNDY